MLYQLFAGIHELVSNCNRTLRSGRFPISFDKCGIHPSEGQLVGFSHRSHVSLRRGWCNGRIARTFFSILLSPAVWQAQDVSSAAGFKTSGQNEADGVRSLGVIEQSLSLRCQATRGQTPPKYAVAIGTYPENFTEKPDKDAVNIKIRFTLLSYWIHSPTGRGSQRAHVFCRRSVGRCSAVIHSCQKWTNHDIVYIFRST